MFDPPFGDELPEDGFKFDNSGYQEPVKYGGSIKIKIDKNSDRLQLLEPFQPWDINNLKEARLLIKAKGKCTTDHISMAGPWLKFRGHLDNISDNMLTGAVNYLSLIHI